MQNIDTQIEELFNAGAHLGHKTNRVHPKSKKYIYKIEEGVSVIDLTKTVSLLKKAQEFISKFANEKKVILVVVTKKLSPEINKLLTENNIPNVTVKWPAGLLTNFEMIMKNVKKLIKMREEKSNGAWNKFVKHEQMKLAKVLIRLEKFYSGLVNLEKLPDALFVVDIKKEKNSISEASDKNIPVIAITDTNVNPDVVSYPIPANDDSLTSIEYIINQVIGAYIKPNK